MNTRTQWFWRAKPAHEGVYERDYSGDVAYALYADGIWHRNGATPRGASKESKMSGWQNLPWRGLAVKP